MSFESWSGRSIEGSHLDLSYNDTSSWMKQVSAGHSTTSPGGILLGDPASGPYLSIAVCGAHPEEFKYPTHYHGSDQFRVILRGVEQSMNRMSFGPGEFLFQDSGLPYKEGVGGAEEVWSFLVAADRRGVAAEMPHGYNGSHTPEQLMADMTDEHKAVAAKGYARFSEMAKSNPGGPKGIPSIATTLGDCRNSFLRGSFGAVDGWMQAAPGVKATYSIYGDRASGAFQALVKAEPGRVAIAAHRATTETVCLVVGGSCTIGGTRYARGDMRFQAADASLEAIVAGPDGADLLFLVGDRRALPVFENTDANAVDWRYVLQTLINGLSPAAVA